MPRGKPAWETGDPLPFDKLLAEWQALAMVLTLPRRPHERLRDRLAELGWTQARLGEEVGVSEAVISRILAGKRLPSLEAAVRIQRSSVGLPAEIWVPYESSDNDESPRNGTEG